MSIEETNMSQVASSELFQSAYFMEGHVSPVDMEKETLPLVPKNDPLQSQLISMENKLTLSLESIAPFHSMGFSKCHRVVWMEQKESWFSPAPHTSLPNHFTLISSIPSGFPRGIFTRTQCQTSFSHRQAFQALAKALFQVPSLDPLYSFYTNTPFTYMLMYLPHPPLPTSPFHSIRYSCIFESDFIQGRWVNFITSDHLFEPTVSSDSITLYMDFRLFLFLRPNEKISVTSISKDLLNASTGIRLVKFNSNLNEMKFISKYSLDRVYVYDSQDLCDCGIWSGMKMIWYWVKSIFQSKSLS
ncbi:hypothetical protein HMI54_012571 [Coelomomyces lativittatus]|nr:hypothetical protein HMI55_004987 [Coelomomyces lativittatus]KAJ1498562.1 hypothetical protein HMI54_012571 [Coelomomyces lativittatus]KAJ1505639.1 hypothetical protein HMI56_001018 [Coelomomyces lativittatus]